MKGAREGEGGGPESRCWQSTGMVVMAACGTGWDARGSPVRRSSLPAPRRVVSTPDARDAEQQAPPSTLAHCGACGGVVVPPWSARDRDQMGVPRRGSTSLDLERWRIGCETSGGAGSGTRRGRRNSSSARSIHRGPSVAPVNPADAGLRCLQSTRPDQGPTTAPDSRQLPSRPART